ncbi:MAG: hypothetical protein OJF47_000875 [Nitrospira sp.]|jgi:hypothetical protein|nr:MAG: hypothetical protein OJF47_000875 [Nitrospira sp.]
MNPPREGEGRQKILHEGAAMKGTMPDSVSLPFSLDEERS